MIKLLKIFITIITISFGTTVSAQVNLWLVDSTFNNLDWNGFVDKAEKEFNVSFYYKKSILDKVILPNVDREIDVLSFLKNSLSKEGLSVILYNKNKIIINKGEKIVTEIDKKSYQVVSKAKKKRDIVAKKKKSNYLKTSKDHEGKEITIGSVEKGYEHKKVRLTGRVMDIEDNSELLGASIFVLELGIGTVVDFNGKYTLKLRKGKYTLEIKEINHKKNIVAVNLLSSGILDFHLEKNSIGLKSVLITAEASDRINNTKLGYSKLMVKRLGEIPLVLGERDILKVAQLLPGIQTTGEGASGFNVRGGSVDQNLFYLDGIPIYNTSHFFGFFSVFNSEAISNFSLYKGNIPIRYGGRLSSIFDIEARGGNKEKFKVRGGISPITGRIMFEGPIKKSKSSFMVGLRSTYSNWVLRSIDEHDFKNSSVSFADALIKLSFDINTKNKVNATGYYSFDDIDFAKKSIYSIKNIGASLNWSHYFGERFNSKLYLIYSKYGLGLKDISYEIEAYKKNNALEHKETRLDFNYISPNNLLNINFGLVSTLYDNDRGYFSPYGKNSQQEEKLLGAEKGLESAGYLSLSYKFSNRLSVLSGVRYNWYSYLGPNKAFRYIDNVVKNQGSILDTLYFNNNDIIRTNKGIDFRLSSKYSFSRDFSIKAAYNRLHQYIFMLSNTIVLSPNDSWKLMDYNINPMVGDQLSLGFYSLLNNRKFELIVEGYYKKINNIVESKDGANLLVSINPEQDVLQGGLNAYGVEITLSKKYGRFNGWINYTYAKSTVLVDNLFDGGKINFGKPYPANQDKPHSLNIVANYKIIRGFSLSSNIVYSTGKPISYPTSIYYLKNLQLINYTERNSYRLPDYFRVDLSVKVEGNLRLKKKYHSTLIFSVYNLLGRHNVYSTYFKIDEKKIQGYKISIFANPIFSITYNFKFGNYEY